MNKRPSSCIGYLTIKCYTGGVNMGLKRTIKRKSTPPHTKVTNFGFDKTIKKIDKAITLLERK